MSHDGQYLHLNIKKHLLEIRKGFKDKVNWILFHHDPAHRINLASNDASKDNKDGSHQEGSLTEVTD